MGQTPDEMNDCNNNVQASVNNFRQARKSVEGVSKYIPAYNGPILKKIETRYIPILDNADEKPWWQLGHFYFALSQIPKIRPKY